MKYCPHCGAEIPYDDAVVCVKCGGRLFSTAKQPEHDDTMSIVIKVFLILGCVAQGWLLLPLAWCIPMTVSVFNSIRDHRPISTGMKVCVLLFVNLIAGICLLCVDDEKL